MTHLATDTRSEPTSTTSLDDRLFEAAVGTLELFGVYLGDRLGLYKALAETDRSAPELADAAGIDLRYAVEWLEQQAVAGFLTVSVDADDPHARRFELPAEHHGVLVDPSDGAHVAPFGRMVVGIANALDEVVAAYRSGDGVPYEHYGADFRNGQGSINRPAFETDLVTAWLPAVPGVDDVLKNGGRIADVGCGQGYSTVAIAKQWQTASVVGVDLDAPSISDARVFADSEGVAARFATLGGGLLSELGEFDVITILEAVHDMAHPIAALRAAREALAPGGVLVIADELVADEFIAPGDEIERMMYGWSITHCLPVARTEPGSAELGTVMRASTLERLARGAGFETFNVIDVDGGFFRIYELRD